MNATRILSLAPLTLFAALWFACSGDPGAAGTAGPPGPPGAEGPAGPAGPAGSAAIIDAGADSTPLGPTGCTSPCHGFGNVVDQWKFSGHFRVGAMAADEPAWTGAGSCGNCHSVDAIERRVANNVSVQDGGVPTNVEKGHLNYKTVTGSTTEIGYSGPGKATMVACTTCHLFTPETDPHNTGKYTAGGAPLRVASGPTDFAMIEKSPAGSTDTVGQSAGAFKAGNTCIYCHKSRKDVTFYVTANTSPGVGTNKLSSANWGPHNGPQSDIYSGKGGYHFTGRTYGTSVHTTVANGCTSCHMFPNAANKDVPDHSMHANLAFCTTCHTTYTGKNFDVQGGQSTVRKALAELQSALDAKGLLTRSPAKPYAALSGTEKTDGNYNLDKVRPGSTPDSGVDQVVEADIAGALYNYLLIARSRDFGVHNPTYTKQLLFDSIRAVTGADPTSGLSRPM